jgi:hypothetical protein
MRLVITATQAIYLLMLGLGIPCIGNGSANPFIVGIFILKRLNLNQNNIAGYATHKIVITNSWNKTFINWYDRTIHYWYFYFEEVELEPK